MDRCGGVQKTLYLGLGTGTAWASFFSGTRLRLSVGRKKESVQKHWKRRNEEEFREGGGEKST